MGQHVDPVTGDKLTALEYFTRQAQVVVRSPWFLLAFNAVTLACMVVPNWRDPWNWMASWMAIQVEWLVGTYMFGQTGRDAVFLRHVARTSDQMDLHVNVTAKEQARQLVDIRRRQGWLLAMLPVSAALCAVAVAGCAAIWNARQVRKGNTR